MNCAFSEFGQRGGVVAGSLLSMGLWPVSYGLFQGCQGSLGVLICLDSRDHRGDLAIAANHERGPLDAQVFSAIHALLFEHAKAAGQGLLLIGQQVKWKG